MRIVPRHLSRLAAVAALSLMCVAGAAVLPDDRADLFWSQYKGGGMDITGESVLVRKKFSEQFAVEGNYFVDKVSGASVDVLSNASVIKDTRKQKSLSLDYIHDKTQYNLSYTNSTERDYISNTTHFSLSQDMFGDLTTVTLGFTDSRDKVGVNSGGTVSWLGHAESRGYEGGVSQIVTKNLIAGATVEVITDQGLLSNPYRSIRYTDSSVPLGYSLGQQIYPNTHTSTAVETRVKYYLPFRAAASLSYRYFSDTWGIRGNTIELGYTHPISDKFILEGRIRHYKQNSATFYSDLFPFVDSQNFVARDQNLAGLTNNTYGFKATWAFAPEGFLIFKRATTTFDVSRIQFKYSDFRNIKAFTIANGYAPGTEPEYAFSAMVYQVYLSVFF
ncbi:MAG: DUF3570 domain-containing protein [Gammaproteobacteria bacterium]